MKPGNYLILLVLPAMVVTGFYLGGYFNFMTPFFCFIVYPLANVFLHSSDNKIPMEAVQPSTAYKFIAFLFVPVLIFLTLWCVRKAGNENLTIVEISGLVISLGIINGVLGFTLAHEFIHRFTKPEQIAGYSLLLQNNYMHYGIEHVWGHHVYACTAEDPNTARYNESIYTFLPRSIIYSYLSALKIERKRLERRKYTTPWLHNRMLWFGLLQVIFTLTVFLAFGAAALLFLLLQNAVAILLLHIVTYMQHYGLVRKKNDEGKYEKLKASHAWNSGRTNGWVSIFQLENHADHHLHAGKRFEMLGHKDESPGQPAGYSFMVLLTLVPPLWFKIMNKRIPSNILHINT